jgi:hypothetical protein
MGTSIYASLAAVQRDLGPILKTRVDAGRGGSYQAFSVDDVYRALHPLFAEHGVILAPQAPVVEYVERDRQGGGVMIDARVTARYLLYGVDGSSIEIGFQAEARDTGDKATIQASQQALKYALVQMFLVAAGDPSAEEVPEAATPKRKTAKDYENAAKVAVLELAGDDRGEAAAAWPLLLEKAGVEKVGTKKAYEAVVRAGNDMFKEAG